MPAEGGSRPQTFSRLECGGFACFGFARGTVRAEDEAQGRQTGGIGGGSMALGAEFGGRRGRANRGPFSGRPWTGRDEAGEVTRDNDERTGRLSRL